MRLPNNKKRRLWYHNPWSQMIRRLSGPPRIEPWKNFTSELQSLYVDSIDEHDLRQALVPIHNVLLLHVGCTLAMENPNVELLSVLCQCWLQVIHTMPSDATCEAVELLSEVLDRYRDNLCIIMHCLEVARILVSSSSVMESLNDRHEKRFLFSIMFMVVTVEHSTIAARATSILKLAAGRKTHTARIMYTAAQIIQEEDIIPASTTQDTEPSLWAFGLLVLRSETDSQLEESLKKIPKKDLLLFLCSLSISPKVALSLSRCEPVIELLFSMARTSDETSKYASNCLSCVAIRGCPKILTDRLIALVGGGSLTVRQKAIPGLYSLLQSQPISSHHSMGSIITSLAELILQHNGESKSNTNDDSCIAATRLLSLMARQLGKQVQWTPQLENCLRIFASLLRTSNNNKLVRISVDTTLELSCNKTLQRPLARQRDLLVAVAHVAANEFSTIEIKSTCIQVLWNLSQETANLPMLARTSEVLEALVVVASSGVDEIDRTSSNYQSCRYAVRNLLRLSELVSNRRILAKRVGLLACLIRFTRSMTLEDETLLMPKDELKEHIVKLVELI